MNEEVIKVENISKKYRLGQGGGAAYRTLRDSLVNGAKGVFRRRTGAEKPKEIWALKDVSFTVRRGDKVGIIGRNGAGKSTLLKILSEITEPTEGEIRLKGRVASLLEVGTGFHPELTGRENIFMNGAMLGMKYTEIKRKFDEIVAFAEVQDFIDTPVKRYSSGMYVRLAFSVAAHLEPEILLVDEVLSVGDAVFQKKCIGKMDEVSKGGRTILFVSHNMLAVQSICQRVICLDNGRIVDDGPAREVIHRYLKGSSTSTYTEEWPDRSTAPGNGEVRLHRVLIRQPHTSELPEVITVHSPFMLEFEYWNLVPGSRLSLCPVLFNEQGILVFGTLPVTDETWYGKPLPAGLFRSTCEVPGNLLNNGMYSIGIYFIKNRTTVIYYREQLLAFDVADSNDLRDGYYGEHQGIIRPLLKWRTELISHG